MEETITLAGKLFQVRRNPRRKRVALGIDASGQYFIGAPADCSIRELEDLLSKDAANLIARVEKRFGKIAPPREFSDGELLYYHGGQYPLRRTAAADAPALYFDGTSFLIREDRKGDEVELLNAWYARRLYEKLRELLPLWTKKIKVVPVNIRIKNVRTLWGSCSARKDITFCTRLALVPDRLLEYVVVHELTHLRHMNHSDAFWQEVEKHLPDYKQRRTELKKSGQKYKWW